MKSSYKNTAVFFSCIGNSIYFWRTRKEEKGSSLQKKRDEMKSRQRISPIKRNKNQWNEYMLIYAKMISESDELKQIPIPHPRLCHPFAKNHFEKTIYWDHLCVEIVYQGTTLICSVCRDKIYAREDFSQAFTVIVDIWLQIRMFVLPNEQKHWISHSWY